MAGGKDLNLELKNGKLGVSHNKSSPDAFLSTEGFLTRTWHNHSCFRMMSVRWQCGG